MLRRLAAIFLLITGVALAALAYSCYSESRMASNVAHYYSSNPEEVPPGENREQRIAAELLSAGRNRKQALLSGTGSILLFLGGTALFVSGRRKGTPASTSQTKSDASLPVISPGSVVLARPIEVDIKRSHTILFVSMLVFFFGISLAMIAVNGLTSVSVLLLALNVSLLFLLYYLESRARRNLAILFDLFGVTRGDRRRFDWSAFRGVDYLMAIKSNSGKEYLWRIELVFNDGKAWLIPRRTRNLEEITNFVGTLPGSHQKRLA